MKNNLARSERSVFPDCPKLFHAVWSCPTSSVFISPSWQCLEKRQMNSEFPTVARFECGCCGNFRFQKQLLIIIYIQQTNALIAIAINFRHGQTPGSTSAKPSCFSPGSCSCLGKQRFVTYRICHKKKHWQMNNNFDMFFLYIKSKTVAITIQIQLSHRDLQTATGTCHCFLHWVLHLPRINWSKQK